MDLVGNEISWNYDGINDGGYGVHYLGGFNSSGDIIDNDIRENGQNGIGIYSTGTFSIISNRVIDNGGKIASSGCFGIFMQD